MRIRIHKSGLANPFPPPTDLAAVSDVNFATIGEKCTCTTPINSLNRWIAFQRNAQHVLWRGITNSVGTPEALTVAGYVQCGPKLFARIPIDVSLIVAAVPTKPALEFMATVCQPFLQRPNCVFAGLAISYRNQAHALGSFTRTAPASSFGSSASRS